MNNSTTIPTKTILPQLVLLPIVLYIIWSIDIWQAISLTFPTYIIIALLAFGLLMLPYLFARRVSTLVIPTLCLVFLVALPFVANSSLKPLMWGVRNLEHGMDRDTVLLTINQQYAESEYPEPTIFSEEQGNWGPDSQLVTHLLLKPQGRAAGLQAETLVLVFNENGYSHASFSPD